MHGRAMLADALDAGVGQVQVVEGGAFGDLEDQAVCQTRLGGDHLKKLGHEFRPHQRLGRDIGRQAQLAVSLGAKLGDHLFGDGEVQTDDQFQLFGHADGFGGALVRLQADQGLEVVEFQALQFDHRLEDQLECPILDRGGEGAGLDDGVLQHGLERGLGAGRAVLDETVEGEAQGAHGVQRRFLGRQSQGRGPGVDGGAGRRRGFFQAAQQVIGRVGAIADQGVLLGAELGRAFTAIGFRADGGRNPSEHRIRLLVVKAVGGVLQPLQFDQFEVEVEARCAGAVQELLGGRHEAGVIVQAMITGRRCAFRVQRGLGQGQDTGNVGSDLRQAAGRESAKPAHLALPDRRQLDPDRTAPVGWAKAADQGIDQIVVGRGDHLAPGFAHRRGLLHAQHLLGRSHQEDDLAVRVDFQKEISTGEGESEKPGGVIGHGDSHGEFSTRLYDPPVNEWRPFSDLAERLG